MSESYDFEFWNDEIGYCVDFEDDGRVAYAYLIDSDNTIVSDVWLYNRCETPLIPEWKDKEKIPFANPEKYAKKNADFEGVNDISEISVEWKVSELVEVRIFIRERLFAILLQGQKPGWSLLAKKDGPLAKVLQI